MIPNMGNPECFNQVPDDVSELSAGSKWLSNKASVLPVRIRNTFVECIIPQPEARPLRRAVTEGSETHASDHTGSRLSQDTDGGAALCLPFSSVQVPSHKVQVPSPKVDALPHGHGIAESIFGKEETSHAGGLLQLDDTDTDDLPQTPPALLRVFTGDGALDENEEAQESQTYWCGEQAGFASFGYDLIYEDSPEMPIGGEHIQWNTEAIHSVDETLRMYPDFSWYPGMWYCEYGQEMDAFLS